MTRRDLADDRARYEDAGKARHDHLVAVDSGDVVEFADPRIEGVVREVSDRLGFDLVGWRLQLRGRARRQSYTSACGEIRSITFAGATGEVGSMRSLAAPCT